MIRYWWMILTHLVTFVRMIMKMSKLAKDDTCTEADKYLYLQQVTEFIKRKSFVKTQVYGLENLPEEGGYVMYPNHQGKYDAYGLLSVHEKPLTVVMDKDKSYGLFIKQVIDMIKGKRLDKENVRQAFTVISEMTEEVKQGRRYILFPEGEYDNQKKNTLINFKSGCFKVSLKSKTPIVPVTLIDSYKAWNSPCLGSVVTQVHFMEPIPYEEYKDMKTGEIAAMVQGRIQEKIEEITKQEISVMS